MHRPISAETLREFLELPHGLSSADVERRRQRYGPNDILDAPMHPWRDLAVDTAKDPMLWFLVGASALYGFLGETAESLTLLSTLVPLVGMDAFLHRRTQASTKGLRVRLASRATVVRDGARLSIPVEEVVPGDLALVSAGDHFPADGILVEGVELQADESALTGEAYPVRKRAFLEVDTKPAGRVEDAHWGFAGTRLLTGQAGLRIVWTGETTLYGEIVRSARQSTHARTPLQLAIGRRRMGSTCPRISLWAQRVSSSSIVRRRRKRTCSSWGRAESDRRSTCSWEASPSGPFSWLPARC